MAKIAVAPLVGAWIEIENPSGTEAGSGVVAPLVGAWIEIALQRGFDTQSMSLPSWERGLKLDGRKTCTRRICVAPLVGAWIEMQLSRIKISYRRKSLPSWERGLKFYGGIHHIHVPGRSPRGSVD